MSKAQAEPWPGPRSLTMQRTAAKPDQREKLTMNSQVNGRRLSEPLRACAASAGLCCLLGLIPALVEAVESVQPGKGATGAKIAGQETGRAVDKRMEASQDIERYLELQAKGAQLSKMEKGVREGKVIDAMWHLATQPLPNDAGFAGQEGDYLNAVAQYAATFYGGLGGAAAYSAWYTYRHTGNADLAFRVGVLSAATSKAFPVNGGMALDAAGAAARKAVVTGAIGGLAIAAAGGDQQAIMEGFLRDGGMVLMQDGFKRYIGSKLVARASDDDAYCMSALGADCPAADSTYARDDKGNIAYKDGKPLPGNTQRHGGNLGGARTAKWDEERRVFKLSPSTVQGMNAMTLFHEHWAISWDMHAMMEPARLAPAVVISYAGSGAMYYELVRKTAAAQGQKIPGVRAAELVAAVESTTAPLEFGTNSAFEAFICEDDGASNSLVVDQPDGTRANCRALSIAGNGRVELIGEASHVNECALKAENHIRDRIQFGQSCFIRESRTPATLIKPFGKAVSEQAIASAASEIMGPAGMTSLALFSGCLGYLARSLRSRNKRKRRTQA